MGKKSIEQFYGKNYTGKGNNPAVVFSLGFCFDWHIGNGDFYDYLERPEAFKKDIHQMDDEYRVTKDYMDYMKNNEKSDGIFDSTKDRLRKVDIDLYRDKELRARAEGAPKYIGVVSFNNDFLRQQGIMQGNALDLRRLKDISRTAMAKMIHTSNKLDDNNVFWTAAIHTNTDNIHIHFSICEKHCMNRDKDMLEVNAFDKLKSVFVNEMIGSKNTIEITSMQRQVLMPLFDRSVGAVKEQIVELSRRLPENKNLWQYNRKSMQPYREMIDGCIDGIIESNDELKQAFGEYIGRLDEHTAKLKEWYGDGNRHLYLDYKKNRLQDTYARFGNSLLKAIAESELGEPAAMREEQFTEQSDLADTYDGEEDVFFSEDTGSQPPLPSPEEKISDVSPQIKWNARYLQATKLFYGTTDTPEDKNAAKALFLEEHNDGNLLATFMLGRLYAVDGDAALSQQYYNEAYIGFSELLKTQSSARTQQYINYRLGNMAHHGLGIEQDYEVAANYYKTAGDYPAALFNLGRLYQKGLGVERSDRSAFECFSRAYELDKKQKLPHNTYALAQCYELGIGVSADDVYAHALYEKALSLFEESVEQTPDENIMYRIGYMYYHAIGTEKNISAAETYLKRSAEKDHEYAQYSLGKLYLEQDRTDEALNWLHRAADVHDNMYAQYALGRIYTESGDIINAEKYLLSSAEKDNEHAQYALGKLYLEQDRTDEALNWLHRAADVHENKYAQYALGKIYAFGDTEQEQDMASRYLQLSAMQGFEPAETLLQRINGIQAEAVQTRQVRNTFHAAGRQVGRNVKVTIYSAERVIGAAGHIAQRTAYENLAHCKKLIAEYDADVEMQEQYRRYASAR